MAVIGGPHPHQAPFYDTPSREERLEQPRYQGVVLYGAQEDISMSKLDQSDRDHLQARQFAFPKQRKEPLEDARHVRNAVARFDQVEGVTDAERDEAWKRIEAAARKFDVKLEEHSWRELGKPKH
jgi:hypothetical protein